MTRRDGATTERRPRVPPERAWRDVGAVASQWNGAPDLDSPLLRGRASGPWWELLEERRLTLLVSREYEHLLVAMRTAKTGPEVSFFPLPHPSGIAVDRGRAVHVASTRNPNQVFTFAPATSVRRRDGIAASVIERRPLVPVASSFLAGCVYLHDLAMIGGVLHGAATGENAVVTLGPAGDATRVWWPRSIERNGRPVFERNHIQLNAIAAGTTLQTSYFAASSLDLGARRPGHRNYPVEGRGVVLSGASREPVAGGLTRPHSLRRHRGRLWVANSGQGELALVSPPTITPVAKLPGWTRGLCLDGDVAFVGTSRVIPRFRAYAPGVDIDRCVCGVHAVDLRSGPVRASYTWPAGNQIFAIEVVPARFTGGFPMLRRRARRDEHDLFFAFSPPRLAHD
jgi:uncharacterized protein (TIGR03032 family)